MKRLIVLLPALFISVSLPTLATAADDSKNCKIVEREGPPPGGSSLSTSVQTGNGTVSAQTSGPNGVTMYSGNGSLSSSVTTGSGGGQTVTTNSDGTCTIYRYKER